MRDFEKVLKSPREEDVQRYLTNRPEILLAAFGWPLMYDYGGPNSAGHETVCVPKFKFGNEYVSDFVVITCRSVDLLVALIELEPPTEKPFTKSGRYAKRLNSAMGQINDWIAWISENQNYFTRLLQKEVAKIYGPGFKWGMVGLHSWTFMSIHGKIIIGRRTMLSIDDDKRRASLYKQTGGLIEIIPYDRLLEIEKVLDEKGLDSIIKELKNKHQSS